MRTPTFSTASGIVVVAVVVTAVSAGAAQAAVGFHHG